MTSTYAASGARLYQLSTTTALVQGVLQGALSSALLRTNGDFGIGTFEHLDGEMVMLDGRIYQMGADGIVRLREDDFMVPFAQVCRLNAPQTCSLRNVQDFAGLKAACNQCRASQNHFYAFRIDAHFASLHARSVRPPADGATLAEAGSSESVFSWTDVRGSLVGFWSPAYTGAFSVPGYHFHFLSEDRSRGGHVLDCSFAQAASYVHALTEFEVMLPTSGPFLTADLSGDPTEVLRNVE